MKAILISDHAKWCALMMNGEKTVEVRKGTALYKAIQKLIDEYGYADIYVYCAKDKPNLWLPYEYDCFELDEASQPYLSDKPIIDIDTKMNGKVIFKFRCYKVEEIEREEQIKFINFDDYISMSSNTTYEEIWEKSCLSPEELNNYLQDKNGCAIHISDLEIFDKPKELSEFKHNVKVHKCSTCCEYPCEEKCSFPTYVNFSTPLTKAPQSWQFIEVGE